jgi:hypothetical protein
LFGCQQAAVLTASPGASATASAGAVPTASPNATPSVGAPSPTLASSPATPSPVQTIAPTARPTEGPLEIEWTRAARIDSPSFYGGANRLRSFKGLFLAIPAYETVIWATDDGLNWRPAFQVAGVDEITDLAVNKDRAVAIAANYDGTAIVYESEDGVVWLRGWDLPEAFRSVGTTSNGFVAVGENALWTSQSGHDWYEALDANSQHVAAGRPRLFTMRGETVAFVEAGSRTEVWQTNGGEWSKLGVLPDSDEAFIYRATQGPRGWVAFGYGGVWFSEDGSTWQKVRPRAAPQDAAVESVIALDVGFVAVGFSGERDGVTCGSGEPLVGHTWTSRDGLDWPEMEQSFRDVAFDALYAREETLFVLANKQGRSEGLGVWTAPLPVADMPAQGVEPYRDPGTGGCGP